MNRYTFLLLVLVAFVLPISTAQSAEPLTLEKAIETALAKNPSLAADSYDKESANWTTAASVSGYLPKVYFVSTWSRMDDESIDRANAGYEASKALGMDVDPGAWENMYQSYISVTQPIFNGGAEISAIMAANTSRLERDYNLENSRLALIRDVKAAYHAVLTSQSLLEVAKEASALAAESLNVAKTRFQIGQLNKSEVLRWEASLADTEVTILEAQSNLENAMYTLANLLGEDFSTQYTILPLTEKQINSDMGAIDIESITAPVNSKDVLSHPSIRQVNQSVSLAKIDTFSSVGKMLPRVNFSYTYSWEQNDTMDLDGEESWIAGVQMEIPIFQSLGGIFGTVSSHKSVRSTQSSLENFTRGFIQQYRIARLNINSAMKRVIAARKGMSFAKETWDMVNARHKLGMTSNLELIDAQLVYTKAHLKVIQAVGDFYQALAAYDYLTAKSKN